MTTMQPLLALLPVVLAAIAPVAAQSAGSCALGGDPAATLRALQAALSGGGAERAAEHAGALAKPAQIAEGTDAPLAAAVAAAAADAAREARAGHLPAAGSATARIGRACVLCHVQRASGAQPFPARGNTIWGRISVKDLGGAARDDRADVVVFLDDVEKAARLSYPVAPPRVSQRGRTFTPSVLPVVLGDPIEFPNDDRIFHNVFSLSKTLPFDLGIYGRGETKVVHPKQTGLIRVFCNIHSDMQCNILVLQNPCFDVTGEGGTYVITGVPDGVFTLRTWNDLGGDHRRRIEVTGGAATRVDLEIRETRQAAPHKNKWGKPYRKKY